MNQFNDMYVGVLVALISIILNAVGTCVLNARTKINFSIFNGTCYYLFANPIALTDPLAPDKLLQILLQSVHHQL